MLVAKAAMTFFQGFTIVDFAVSCFMVEFGAVSEAKEDAFCVTVKNRRKFCHGVFLAVAELFSVMVGCSPVSYAEPHRTRGIC